MTIQNRLFSFYAAFVAVVLIVAGIIYYMQSSHNLEAQEKQALLYNAEQAVSRFDDKLSIMENGIEFMLSDIDALDSLIMLGNDLEKNMIPKVFLNEAIDLIRQNLSSYYMEKNFYRVVFFNQNGYVVANNNREESQLNTNVSIKSIQWLDRVMGLHGKDTLIGLHQDDWGSRQQPVVFSVVKEIQGNRLGFIEVQCLASDLDVILKKPNQDTGIILFADNGDLLYSSDEQKQFDYYQSLAQQAGNSVAEYVNPNNQVRELVAVYHSQKYQTTLLAVENFDDIHNRQLSDLSYIFVFWILIALASLGFIWFIAFVVTRPVQQLRKMMEKTDYNNLADIPELKPNAKLVEIEAFYNAYHDLIKRLKESIEHEKESTQLQMQAQFDTLQAQVNPHFIYNVLNAISQRGMQLEDETICEICGGLADILRYSTDTRSKLATIAEELESVDRYCFLLKTRFQHRFEYSVQVDASIQSFVIPKLSLQQLVENSITHGFANSTEQMKIGISGWYDAGKIQIKVQDNGSGFDPEQIRSLNDKFALLRARIDKHERLTELKIGGMGLENTYARLYLLYRDQLSFDLQSQNGAVILITVNQALPI